MNLCFLSMSIMHSLITFIMYTNLKVHADSKLSSNAQNIQTTPKCRKLLSGVAYRKAHLVDENGQSLHPANCNNIASSSHNTRIMMAIIIAWYINVIISKSN